MLEEDGWQLHSTRGSHMQFTHPAKPGRVTVPFHGNRDLAKSVVASIRRQAGLK